MGSITAIEGVSDLCRTLRDGHYRAKKAAENRFYYIVETESGQITPSDVCLILDAARKGLTKIR